MRSLLGFSGGIESTVMALEKLRDTEDEVILVNLNEQRHYPDAIERGKIEAACTKACAKWYADNIRPAAEVRYDELPVLGPAAEREEPDAEIMQPVRKGYAQKTDIYIVWGKEKLHALAAHAEAVQADEVLTGMCLWDTCHDFQETIWVPYFKALTDIPIRHPYYTAHADGTYSGVGRFELQSRIPEDLLALTVKCHQDEPPTDACWRCELDAYYREHCAGKTLEEIRAVDDALHRKYFLGPYVNDADPATYDMWDKYELAVP